MVSIYYMLNGEYLLRILGEGGTELDVFSGRGIYPSKLSLFLTVLYLVFGT
jgi:hypothetical protein